MTIPSETQAATPSEPSLVRACARSQSQPQVSTSTSLQLATSTRDELAAAIQDLRLRGVTNPEQFAALGVEAVAGAVRWFDAQGGRVGPGVLFNELRSGGKPGWTPAQAKPRSLLEQQRDYAREIGDWLSRNFPEFDRPGYGPHPAAVATVIQLHYRDRDGRGRGSLTKQAHGPEIRAAVKVWERKWTEPTTQGVQA